MKKILSVALIAGFSFGFNIMPYGAYINYSSKSTKDKGYVGGVYASIFKSPYKLELDLEHTLIKYKDNTTNWKQTDLTAIFNFFKGYNFAYKVGIHNIWQKQDNSEYDKVFIAGAKYYKYLKYNFGVDGYYSDYKYFNVYQISPYVGYNYGDYNSNVGSFYIEAKLNQIYINKKDITNKQNYTNLDLKLSNSQGPFTTTIKTEIGKSAYKVANGGFVVYNLGDETQYSYGIDINYAINKVSSFKVGYNRSKYKENGLDTNYYSNVYTLSYLRAF